MYAGALGRINNVLYLVGTAYQSLGLVTKISFHCWRGYQKK